MIDVVSPRMRHSARVRFQMRSHSVNPLCCQFTTTTTATTHDHVPKQVVPGKIQGVEQAGAVPPAPTTNVAGPRDLPFATAGALSSVPPLTLLSDSRKLVFGCRDELELVKVAKPLSAGGWRAAPCLGAGYRAVCYAVYISVAVSRRTQEQEA